MSFVKIRIFAVMLSLSANLISNAVKDVSNECAKNDSLKYYLSTGFGESDGIALMVAYEKEFSCLLGFFVQPTSFINLIIEFPDTTAYGSICVVGEIPVVTVSEFRNQGNCVALRKNGIYAKVQKEQIFVQIVSSGKLNTVKVTSTAMRLINSSRCMNAEVQCVIDNNYFCISSVFLCDGDKNCGDKSYFDESDCGNRSLPPLTVIFTIAMSVTTIWLISSILTNLFPMRGRTFIHRVDEQMSPYDAWFSNLHTEVTVLIVFPSESSKIKNLIAEKPITVKRLKFDDKA